MVFIPSLRSNTYSPCRKIHRNNSARLCPCNTYRTRNKVSPEVARYLEEQATRQASLDKLNNRLRTFQLLHHEKIAELNSERALVDDFYRSYRNELTLYRDTCLARFYRREWSVSDYVEGEDIPEEDYEVDPDDDPDLFPPEPPVILSRAEVQKIFTQVCIISHPICCHVCRWLHTVLHLT